MIALRIPPFLVVALFSLHCAGGEELQATSAPSDATPSSDGAPQTDAALADARSDMRSGSDSTDEASGMDVTTIDATSVDGRLDSFIPVDVGIKDSIVVDIGVRDTSVPDTKVTGSVTGGPCLSGSAGSTAFRLRWTNGGGRATVNYEKHGLPDKSRWKASSNGYSIGYSPSFVDPFLGEGGLQLDSSNFIDVEMSTVGLASIKRATLAVYGRSYNTTTSGSFNWQTFTGTGKAPTDLVSNAAPYKWYSADATSVFVTGDGGVLLRIKAGPSSGALVVNRLELCIDES